MKSVTIDRNLALRNEPRTGHNRWHPDVPPVSRSTRAMSSCWKRAMLRTVILNAVCRSALFNMMNLLQDRGYTREQAYVICSVAVDLRISNVVDVPNYVVSALLPEDIFRSCSVTTKQLRRASRPR
jgi:hypothetical protein